MENCAFVLSLPGALVATSVYRYLLLRTVSKYPRIARIFNPASLLILALFAAEVLLLAWKGSVQSRALIGPVFEVVHLVIFVLGTPALANILVLRAPDGVLARGYIVIPSCTMFAVILVGLHYGVMDQLYGKFGQGPYSTP